jgi:glycerophosphoryl diester phosphodiesterase
LAEKSTPNQKSSLSNNGTDIGLRTVTDGTLIRVGHGGASNLAPANTLQGFDEALRVGVDMIEFDVLAVDAKDPQKSPIVLAHDHDDDLSSAVSLQKALHHLSEPKFADVNFVVDLKLPGYEERTVTMLREAGLIDRVLFSTQYFQSLTVLRNLDKTLKLGWSYPKAKRDHTQSALKKIPVMVVLALMRRRLPRRAKKHLTAGDFDFLMAYWRLVTPRLIEAVSSSGGKLFVWTVDDAARIRSLGKTGVFGVITNDPRLFDD